MWVSTISMEMMDHSLYGVCYWQTRAETKSSMPRAFQMQWNNAYSTQMCAELFSENCFLNYHLMQFHVHFLTQTEL